MADKRASLFTLVTAAYGTNYVPLLVQLSPGTYANCRIAVSDFVTTVVPPDDLALQAYNLAVTGTNAAAAAQSTANTALSEATSAFSIAVIGTNAASAAQSTATTALGTANTALSTANSAFSIAVAGTNAAAVAQLTANNATNLATSALNSASGASDFSLAAYHLAQIGTNTGTAAYNLASAALPSTGGTITGDLTVTGRMVAEQWIDVPSTLTYAGTTIIDFDGPSSLTLSLPSDTQFATANLAGTNLGKMIKVAITATGAGTAALNLTYPSWKVIGGSLASNITNGKSAILSLELYGTADADVWAVMASES